MEKLNGEMKLNPKQYVADKPPILNVKIGLDPSTKNCGVAIIINDKPGYYHTFYFDSKPTEQGSQFGNRMVDSGLNEIGAKIALILKTHIESHKWFQVASPLAKTNFIKNNLKVIVAIENGVVVSGGKLGVIFNLNNQKLSLFAGAILYSVSESFDLVFKSMCEIDYKIIAPQEWQILRIPQHISHKGKSKSLSIQFANEHLKEHNSKLSPIEDDNSADAMNIAIVADQVRDIVKVRREKRERKRMNNQYIPKQINILQTRRTLLFNRGLEKKYKFLQKIKDSKKSKYVLEVEELKSFKEFLVKSDQLKLENIHKALLRLQNLKKELATNILKK